MAIVGNTYITLKDKLAQTENGRAASAIVDLLAQSNAIIEDAVVRECNEGSTHKTTVRNGLPEVEFRKFYQGVNCSKVNTLKLLIQQVCLKFILKSINH